jgi:neutral trehalase
MESVMWDDEEGFFYPRFDRDRPRNAMRRCASGLAPLITGLVDRDKARRVIEGALLHEDHFRGPWLVPFNSISETEETIPFEERLLWRGHCIWANMNWIAARAASAYGREDLAREITRATALLVSGEGFREFYDPRTGKGAGASGFTWPALVLDMIDRHGL